MTTTTVRAEVDRLNSAIRLQRVQLRLELALRLFNRADREQRALNSDEARLVLGAVREARRVVTAQGRSMSASI